MRARSILCSARRPLTTAASVPQFQPQERRPATRHAELTLLLPPAIGPSPAPLPRGLRARGRCSSQRSLSLMWPRFGTAASAPHPPAAGEGSLLAMFVQIQLGQKEAHGPGETQDSASCVQRTIDALLLVPTHHHQSRLRRGRIGEQGRECHSCCRH